MSKINEKIAKIWNSFSDFHNGRAPLFYDHFEERGFLSIGLNPSFNKKFLDEAGREVMHNDTFNAEDFFEWENIKSNLNEFVEEILEIDRRARNPQNPYRFYSLLFKLAEEIGMKCQCADMFLLRETNQKNLKNSVCSKKCSSDHPVLNNFGEEQFNVLVEIIQMINPKMILVANAFASKIFKYKLSSSLKWEEEIGTYMLSMKELSCPVFLCSMLTGGALDVFSRERLIWHMKKVIKRKG